MATYVNSPRMQFFDSTNTGAPLVEGTLTVYSAGTTTLSTIYSTIDDFNNQTNAIDNPVTLDSRGECQIVLSESSKFLLKDSDGNTIWTIDDIQSTTGDIFDINGNELIKFTPIAGAINEITVANASVGNKPSISFTGNDTNVGGTIATKGTATLAISSSATTVSGTLDVTGVTTLGAATINNITNTTSIKTPLIKDSNGNSALAVTATSSAVDYFTLVNGATGTPGSIQFNATGTSTNIDTVYKPKGTGMFSVSTANLTTPVIIYNGTGSQHSTTFSMANTSASRTVTFPDADGTISFLTLGTQAEQETATSTTNAVCSGRQQYHPSAAKVWAKFGVTGNILASYNVSSITDSGTGNATVNYTVAMSSTSYSVTVSPESSGGFIFTMVGNGSYGTSSVVVTCFNTAGAATDPTSWGVHIFGDQ